MNNSESDPQAPTAEPGQLTVRLPTFEGPLDLLLHLIRKHELDIRDIPIVLVTEQYIEYLNLMKELNLDLAGEYLVMAATLIHIKSRMLLPQEPAGESGEEEDPRAELVRQLLEYEKFKRVADILYEKDRVERATHPRGAAPEFEVEEDVLVEASLFDLVAAFKDLLDDRKRSKPHIVMGGPETSVAERVAELLALIATRPRLEFRELFTYDSSREGWIVTFLAVLELARAQAVRILQRVARGELVLERREPPPGVVPPLTLVAPVRETRDTDVDPDNERELM